MKPRITIVIAFVAALAACGGRDAGGGAYMPQADVRNGRIATPQSRPSAAGVSVISRQNATVPTYRVLHSFSGNPDGASPYGSLVGANGTLYGTTGSGGTRGGGTVFRIDITGAHYRVVHNFGLYSLSPQSPNGDLLAENGLLYGATINGGAHYAGTLFRIGTTGTAYSVLYNFCSVYNCADGATPNGGLVDVKGVLYGTTSGVAAWYTAYENGTVFRIGTTGAESTVHVFGGPPSDGAFPNGLTRVNGVLYGTTAEGGAYYAGTVFSISVNGTEKVLHDFGKGCVGNGPCSDGQFPCGWTAGPTCPLLDVNGTLYGTTSSGGTLGKGTVFSVSATGVERVLHDFGSGSDGAHPSAGLTYANGTLYGTTVSGGSAKIAGCYDAYGPGPGCGTVFSISTTGKDEAVLHSFSYGSDGAFPNGLTSVKGTLYGTTIKGGDSLAGDGTVFALTP